MSFKKMAKMLGGKVYKIKLKDPNNEDNNEELEVYGVWQDLEKITIDKDGLAASFDGEFYCKEELDKRNYTILLEIGTKKYQLLRKYSFSDLETPNYLKAYKHVCYRAKEYGSAN